MRRPTTVLATPVATLVAALLAMVAVTSTGADVAGARSHTSRISAGSWTVQPSGTSGFLSGVSCVNAAAAWASGQNGTILRTTNGGASWAKLSSPLAAGTEATDVEFVSPTIGWVIGSANAILKSTNGGATWSARNFLGFTYPPYLLTLSATDASHAWIGGYDSTGGFTYDAYYSILLGTSDGSAWWSSAQMAAGDYGHGLTGIDFVGSQRGWAVTVDGSFTITTDGGRTWTTPLYPTGVDSFSDVSFADATNGWAVGQDSSYAGFIMHTTDGGRTWYRQAQSTLAAGPVAEVTAICAVSPSVAWAVCRGGFVVYTTNAGGSWTIERPTTRDLKDVSFATADTGWIVGDAGTILRHGPRLAVDNVRPVPRALAAAKVRRGKMATLKYRVDDAAPSAGTATVVIKIKNAAGKVKKTLRLGRQPTGTALKARFRANLKKGVYKWYVYATDAAGNRQSKPARQKLTVK